MRLGRPPDRHQTASGAGWRCCLLNQLVGRQIWLFGHVGCSVIESRKQGFGTYVHEVGSSLMLVVRQSWLVGSSGYLAGRSGIIRVSLKCGTVQPSIPSANPRPEACYQDGRNHQHASVSALELSLLAIILVLI